MIKPLLFSLTIALRLCTPVSLSAVLVKPLATYKMVEGKKNTLKFVATMNGAPIEGAFKDFAVDILFSPNDLAKSKVKVEVKTASVSVANEDVATNIVLPEWLSVEAFPKAVFTSKTFSHMPATDNYYVDGELSLRGKTVPMVLNIQLEYVDDIRVLATGYATLRRSQFGVGQGQWESADVIQDEVRVEFRLLADRQ
jgi:polyisoprenoid-binding protein YceI